MSHFMRLHGRAYLEATLTHFFETLLPKDIFLEVDPNRASADAGAISHGCTVQYRRLRLLYPPLSTHVPHACRVVSCRCVSCVCDIC